MKALLFVTLWLGLGVFLNAQEHPEAIIREGSAGEAQTLSGKQQALVLHISGGQGEKYSALQYGQMLQIMFHDSTRTKYPMTPHVLYEESPKERPTAMGVYLRGRRFDKNGGEYKSGDGVFHPAEVLKYISEITKKFTQPQSNHKTRH